jgi:PD-(D/E)XK nuclease superfamily
MNPFEHYGIAHLSPSSCNQFLGSPAMFVLNKVLKYPTNVGAAAHRGTSVETGVAHGLFNSNAPVSECIEKAMDQFRTLTALTSDPRVDKETVAVPEMVRIGLEELRRYGVPSSAQGQIHYAVEGLDVPLTGFYDFEWEEKGVLVDLKTTHALPSQISAAHARQVALYKAARGDNLSARLTYVTPKKTHTLELENHREHLASLVKIAKTIQKFLSLSEDGLELASYVVPNIDDFYFNDAMTRQSAFEVWGI